MTSQIDVTSVFKKNKKEILESWEREQKNTMRSNLIKASEVRDQSNEFFTLFCNSLERGNFSDIHSPEWTSVRETVSSFEDLAQVRGITLETKVDGACGEIRGDRERIQQVLQNLLSNAFKFTPNQGKIGLELSRNSEGIVFLLSDTGRGIDQASIDHIFDRYWQGHKGTREGVGLGLAIVKGIVTAHGGKVRVESTVGKGTTFIITLPQ